ncbi:hypothetical protein F2Q70_00022407 [Brassica cretica]|uniref:CCHC-type domain-containing protein n=1 Tax=Brassica cretica TaxID=69181 RepID=A0A8S9GQ88_BRACR|nr:hypothetical protein F2Q70_00022407 [Brassica cretica]
MAAVQQGQQIPHGPQAQVQQGPQIHMQQAPPVHVQHYHQVPHQPAPVQQYPQVPVQPVPGVFQVPPPPPVFPVQVPEVDEIFIRVLGQMKYKRPWEQTVAPRCGRCRRHHFGECFQCYNCDQFGHLAKNCRKLPRTQAAAPATVVAPAVAARNCYGCNQPGHIYRDCPRRGNAALPPPPKRPAIAPRVFAVGDPQGAEPIAGLCISSYIADKDDAAALQLDEIYQVCFLYSTVCNQMSLSALTVDHHHQMFLERMELEKKRMQDRMVYCENDNIENRSAACCIFRPEIVATGFGFTGWMEIYSIARSESSSLDVELLAVLQHLLVAQSTEHKDLLDIRNLHKPALEYSLSSTRPPQTLVAHQKLLWAIDARASVLRVDTKIAGFVLEMWYWWHSVLWKNCQIGLMSISEIGNCRIMSPSMLIQLVKTATIDQIL